VFFTKSLEHRCVDEAYFVKNLIMMRRCQEAQRFFLIPPHPNPLPPLRGEEIRRKNFWQRLYLRKYFNLMPAWDELEKKPEVPASGLG
jgi:hypothetical protein